MTGALDAVHPGQLNKRRSGLHTRVARPRPSLLGSNAEKRQSSLTQLDFVSTPKNAETVEIWSDEGSELDIDAGQSRKKRRVSAGKSGSNGRRSSAKLKVKEKGQNTLTQIAWLPTSSKVEETLSGDDEPGFNIYDDEGRERFAEMVVQRQVARRKKLPWLNHASGEERATHQTPARRYDLRSPVKARGPLDDSGYISGSTASRVTPAKRYNLRTSVSARKTADPKFAAASAGAVADGREVGTPSKSSALGHVPASQTTPSIKASSQQSHVSTVTQATTVSPTIVTSRRVPLGERNANTRLRPLRMEQGNDLASKTMKVPIKQPSHTSVPATLDLSTEGEPVAEPPRSRRKLKRTLTVQDSQLEDFSIPTLPPPRQLIRSTTISETQFDSLDMDTIDDLDALENAMASNTDTHPEFSAVSGSEQYLDDGPHTYDPVGAALDRDAARFAWTQTQLPRKRVRDAVEDSETDDDPLDDVDADVVSKGQIATVDLTSSPHRPSQQLLSDLIDPISPQAARISQPHHEAPIDQLKPNKVNQSKVVEESEELIADSSPPSSPPALRQSQVSTVVPTQASIYQHSLRAAATADRARVHATQHTPFGDVLSSSPLPLPPWSSSSKDDWLETTEGVRGTQIIPATMQDDLGSLTDFSLPPPPPLVKSSSPWTE
ncbi:hypothetical protein LTR95_017048 [Oleoguttula sp. CCFEE 5521]